MEAKLRKSLQTVSRSLDLGTRHNVCGNIQHCVDDSRGIRRNGRNGGCIPDLAFPPRFIVDSPRAAIPLPLIASTQLLFMHATLYKRCGTI